MQLVETVLSTGQIKSKPGVRTEMGKTVSYVFVTLGSQDGRPAMATNHSNHLWWQRLAQRFASSRIGSWLFSYSLHHIDKLLLRLSRGRVAIPRNLGGLPVVRLTTTGAKTNKKRTVPVVGLRDGD